MGGQIRNGNAISVDSVFFLRDTIIAGSSVKRFQLVLGSVYSEMNKCYIDLGDNFFYVTSIRSVNRQSTNVNNSVIYIGNGQIISASGPSQNAVVRFANNKIYCRKYENDNSWFNLKYGDVKFSKNEIYLPSSFISAGKDIYIGSEKLKLNNSIKKQNN